MSTWKYIIVLDIKGKHNFNRFTFILLEIPTNKGANSYKLKISKINRISIGKSANKHG